VSALDHLFALFNDLGSAYRGDRFDLSLFPPLVAECYSILNAQTSKEHYADIRRNAHVKTYWVFVAVNDVAKVSRPYRPSLFINSYAEWESAWKAMLASMDRAARTMTYRDTDRVIYSAAIVFFAVIDILRPGSRKTNGTFLEWLLGTLLVLLTGYPLTRHIPIAAMDALVEDEEHENGSGSEGSVPTDIVIDPGDGKYKLVFPVKTSTRERIGQIFTHQRILDTEFPGRYRSALLCVSETQLMKKTHGVQETCVPRQVSFNEKYIAHVDALYYLDPPFAYIDDAIAVSVRRMSDLFRVDLAAISEAAEHVAAMTCNAVISTVNCNREHGHAGEHLFSPPRGTSILSPKLTSDQLAD
jgi:hypothetical protein